ncbi:MAG TPA: hypothetical protein VJQ82_19105 [Terriglobales bacterium]|nr:hypothetical protein [Terriglobales bacterium]
MIGVENFFRLDDVDIAAGSFCPRQHGQPFDVVASDTVVGSHWRHAGKTSQLFQGFFLHLVGHTRLFDLLAQFFGVASAFILLTQFFLDGLHLLA